MEEGETIHKKVKQVQSRTKCLMSMEMNKSKKYNK